MVWIPLKYSNGQVLKGIKLKAPIGSIIYTPLDIEMHLKESKIYEVIGSKRMGINRYRIFLNDGTYTMNHHIRKTKKREGWELIGKWHTPEEISILFGSKLDPDANKPRPSRESFWSMKSKPGSHNYRQKKRLMKLAEYQKFNKYFATTISDIQKINANFVG